jgi:cytoskeletal protein RodZ
MNHDELLFEEFLAARMREKGITLKRLGEATGIAPIHLENMLRGDFEHMPSTPYFRGYVMRVAKVLDFDGEEWWGRLKKEGPVKDAGPADVLPKNRFVKQSISKSTWIIGAAAVIVVIYLTLAFPRIAGKPILTVTFPASNPYAATSTTITFRGTVRNADALYLNNEEIAIAKDGSWEKLVLLSENSPNTFAITAKKLLGGETTVTEQIIYSSSSTSSFPTIHSTPETPATGTFFN